jgi:hypothetical protein
MESGRQIDGDDRVPALGREIFDGGGVLYAGIVHENIDAAQFTRRGFDQLLNLGRLRQIGGIEMGFDAEITDDPLSLLFDRERVAKAVQHDLAAGLGKGPSDAEPYAACRSCDDGCFAAQHSFANRWPTVPR